MTVERDFQSIILAGASSLVGAELKTLLEESRFAGWDFTLLDEELAAGTLTHAAGEPAVILPIGEGSFDRARFVFFTGSPEFTKTNLQAARSGGATVIDLSGGSLGESATQLWYPRPEAKPLPGKTFAVPSAPATVSVALLVALAPFALQRLALLFFRPVSEAGRGGIEDLETQTAQLLSMQTVGHSVFGTQVAFNMLDRFPSESRVNLANVKARVRQEVSAFPAPQKISPSIEIVHAPVFYGYSFSALVETATALSREQLAQSCEKAGFRIWQPGSTPLGNLSAEDAAMHLALPDVASPPSEPCWLWGAVDNLKLPATNAIKLAELLS